MSHENDDRPVRLDLVEHAIKFLSNPRVGNGNTEVKIAFLKHKGLTDAEVMEALRLSSGQILGKK